MKQNVLLLLPDAFSATGGIQTYSRLLLRALQDHPELNISAVIKNDLPCDVPSENLVAVGHRQGLLRTASFCYRTMTRGLFQRPDIIISTLSSFGPLLGIVSRLTGARTGMVGHGIEVWKIQSNWHKRVWQKLDLKSAISHYTAEKLIEQGLCNLEDCTIIHPPFDEEKFAVTGKSEALLKRYNLTKERRIVLSVGRVEESENYKGFDQILDALPSVARMVPQVHYLHIGKGDGLERLRARVAREGLAGMATFCGYVPDSEMCDYYNLCDVFCMPSTGEGFGIVFLEALACGKPVIMANVGGSPDILDPDLPAKAIDPGHPAAIAEALIRSLNEAEHFNSEEVRRLVIEKFGFRRFAQEWYLALGCEPI